MNTKHLKTLITAIFLVIVLSVSASAETWEDYADTSWFDGPGAAAGTASDPYVIKTANELAGFAKICNDNINYSTKYTIAEFTGKTIVLANDIDLKNIEWIPIARLTVFHSNGFNGTFDGRGHSIKNLYISKIENPTKYIKVNGVGLFANLAASGVIKNLRVEGSVTTTQSQAAAAIVGYNMYGTIANVSTSCDILAASTRTDNTVSSGDWETGIGGLTPGFGKSGRGYAGGIVGVSSGGNIINCVVYGTIRSNPVSYAYAAGLVGYASNDAAPLTNIKNCVVLARSIKIEGGSAVVCAGLTGGMLQAVGSNSYWLKQDNNDDQPSNAGTTNPATKISQESDAPLSCVLLPQTDDTKRHAEKDCLIKLSAYPLLAKTSDAVCKWDFDDISVRVVSTDGTSALINSTTSGDKTFTVTITGINGIASDDVENAVTLRGQITLSDVESDDIAPGSEDVVPEKASSSGGGCSAGYGLLALLAIVPAALRRKKN